MGFKDIVERDIKAVFLNTDEFADKRTVLYDGNAYVNIPIVLTSIKEKSRHTSSSDHAQGLYTVAYRLYVSLNDLGGILPEKGMHIRINDTDDDGSTGYFRDFHVAESVHEMGMVRLDLEATDE